MRLSRGKGVFQFKLICRYFSLTNAFMPLVLICMIAYNTLIIKQHKEPDHIKALVGTEPFGDEEALLENIKILF